MIRFLTLVMASLLVSCQGSAGPVELGTVKWSRDLDASLKLAEKTNKPVFLLFQEVPG